MINRLLAKRGYAQQQATDQLCEQWTQAAGTRLANHSRPAKLSRGRLEIVVRNSTVLQELTFQKKQLLSRMQANDTKPSIRDIRFRIGTDRLALSLSGSCDYEECENKHLSALLLNSESGSGEVK